MLLERLKTNEAVPLFEDYLNRHPDDLTAVRGLAQCAAATGDLEKAIGLLRSAHEKDPDNFDVQKAYGEVLLASGDAASAVEVLAKAYRAVPEHANLAYSLARSLKASGRSAEAEPLLVFVADSRPQLDLLIDLERQLRIQPGNLELRMQIAAIVAKYVSRQDAIRWYQNLLQISPDYSPAHQELVELYRQTGDEKRAEFHHRFLAQKSGDNPSANTLSPIDDSPSRPQSIDPP